VKALVPQIAGVQNGAAVEAFPQDADLAAGNRHDDARKDDNGDERQDHRRIADLVAEVEAECVVVGLPLSLDGSIGPAAEKALAEVERLAAVLSVPVETYDERLTTVTAERVLREQGVTGRRRRQVIDQVAASVLLQAWLDARSAAPEDDDGHP